LPGLTNTSFILELFSENTEQAYILMREFTEIETLDNCMEDNKRSALSDTKARQVIERVLNNKPVSILGEMPKPDRDAVLQQLKQDEGLSIRQISRLTGVSFNIVKRA
jgi:putative transposase